MTFVDDLQNDILPFLADEATAAALLKRILLFLEDGEFIQADLYCEKVLDVDPENPLAYLCKLMASRRISSLKDLSTAQYIVDSDSSYKKAVRFAPAPMQQHLHRLNMRIYANSIYACRNRAKIHIAHGELKEAAQQYHNAMKMWEDSHKTLPDADAVYNDLSTEIADFNWKLLLYNRQCPDDEQLIARSIPINNDRWYLSAIKWADTAKKEYFTSVANKVLLNTHSKCLECIKSRQTRLAEIWAGHYKAAAADDPLVPIHQALVDTDGFTKFVAGAPAALLALIKQYKACNPPIAEEMKAILQVYYGKIFQRLLDFTGKQTCAAPSATRLDGESYAIMIAQQEANACVSGKKPAPAQDTPTTVETPGTDPLWATDVARKITGLMADAISEDLSPYSVVTTHLIAAKELTIRYGKKDGIVTEPLLFRFICGYYADAIAQAPQEQVAAIQSKFDDFLLDTARLPSVSAEIVTEASAYMNGNPLPYQIYLAHITNNYSAKAEELIPPEITKNLDKWQKYLETTDPKRNCYSISDRQDAINAAFSAAEEAIYNCRHYTESLQRDLDASYQQILASSGEGREALSADWEQKMASLQETCDGWAQDLADKLNRVQELNAIKLPLAQKRIAEKERWQLTESIGLNLLLVLTVVVFAQVVSSAIGNTWRLMDAYHQLPQQIGFYAANIAGALVAAIVSLSNGLVAPTYSNSDRQKRLWLFILLGIFPYVCIYPDITGIKEAPAMVGILALTGIVRVLLEFFLCKLNSHSRSHKTQVSCRIGSIAAKVAGVAQWLVCLGLAALYICCLLLIL